MKYVLMVCVLCCLITSARPPVDFAEIVPGEVCQFWYEGRAYPVIFYDTPFMGEWSFYGQTPPSGGIGIFNAANELVAVTKGLGYVFGYDSKDAIVFAGIAMPMISPAHGILDVPVTDAIMPMPEKKVPSFVMPPKVEKKKECPPGG